MITIDPNFKSFGKSFGLRESVPTSVKKQLWEKLSLVYFKFNGQFYYIDKRYESPFGYEYDIWQDNGLGKLQHRIYDDYMVYRIINYINRKKKLDKILGKKD